MSILSNNTLRSTRVAIVDGKVEYVPEISPRDKFHIVEPFFEKSVDPSTNTTFGVSYCGYDIRIDQNVDMSQRCTMLASSMEKVYIPRDVMAVVHDKSSWARRGLAVQNTVLEPGYYGFLTLELTFTPLWKGDPYLLLKRGTPIAQVIFHKLDHFVDGYNGKYQNQKSGPQSAL